MSKSIEQLKQTLAQENKVYEEILTMAEDKTKVIVRGKVRELEMITKKEQQYIHQLGTFDKIRRSIFANIAEELGIKEPASVSELLLSLEDEEANEIDELRNQLMKTVEELNAINKRNEKLIEESLQYIQFNIDMMTQMNGTGNQYGHGATEKEKAKVNLFDVRV